MPWPGSRRDELKKWQPEKSCLSPVRDRARAARARAARTHWRVPMIRMMVLPGAAGSGARCSGCLRRLDRLCRRCRSRPARAGRYCSVAAGVLEGVARAIVWMTMTVLDVLWSPVRGSGRP